jgi:hypothetical protein
MAKKTKKVDRHICDRKGKDNLRTYTVEGDTLNFR